MPATHLECTRTGERYSADELQTLSSVGAPLYARYDLETLAKTWSRDSLAHREPDMWRYLEVLPVRSLASAVRLGEGWTPLLRAPRLEPDLEVWIKDEAQNPTASFKARGLAMAVSRAVELGVTDVALPSAGNAGSAAAAYAAAAGIAAHVVMPSDTPAPIVAECRSLGADLQLMDALIDECGAVVKKGVADNGWFALSTLKEPYRVEGKKTMGYELAEQMGWQLPDVIIYPTGGGTGLVGMWKAFAEMQALGWIDEKRPRMVSVQAAGCAPMVRAWKSGAESAERWENAQTFASGLRVPGAVGDFLILRAVRESGGAAVAVTDEEMEAAQHVIGAATGVFPAPEGGATLAALPQLRELGVVRPGDRVVLFNTGSGLKYVRT